MDLLNFGKRLEALRKEMGYSQDRLSQELNITGQSVSKWENGVAYPTVDSLVQLSRILNVSLDELVTGMNYSDRFIEERLREIFALYKQKRPVEKALSLFLQLLFPIESKQTDATWILGAREITKATLLAMLEDKEMTLLKFNIEFLKGVLQFGEFEKDFDKMKAYFKDKSPECRENAEKLFVVAKVTRDCYLSIVQTGINGGFLKL